VTVELRQHIESIEEAECDEMWGEYTYPQCQDHKLTKLQC
jgi:hypothetical protein